MAEPMMKENERPSAPRWKPDTDALTPQGLARAKELERQLGRPLRQKIEGPLTEAEAEEQLLARLTQETKWIPLDEFLARHGRA